MAADSLTPAEVEKARLFCKKALDRTARTYHARHLYFMVLMLARYARQLEAEKAELKKHAEAMAEAWSGAGYYGNEGCVARAVKAYRQTFPRGETHDR